MNKIIFTISMLLLTLTAASDARAADTAKPADVCYNTMVIADPELPVEVRELELQKLRNSAETDSGSGYGAYLLGSLYRLGPEHPAALLPRDLAQAEHWLGRAALKGELNAMGGLAEIALIQNQAMDAMIWAQVLTYYEKKQNADIRASFRYAYNASLLKRSFDALGKDVNQQDIEGYFNGFLSKYGKTIDAALDDDTKVAEESDESDGTSPKCADRYDSDRWPLAMRGKGRPSIKVRDGAKARKMNAPGFGYFLVEVDQQGSVNRVLIVDSLPDVITANGLLNTVKRINFNSIKEKDAPMRVALLPMKLDDYSIYLRD